MPWRETPAELERARAEQAIVVERPSGSLVGIFTPAAEPATASGKCVVFFSRPRFEYHRLTVEAARRMAAAGLACFRFDYTGWGDSEGESPVVDLDRPFTDDGLAVLAHLSSRLGMERFILWGSCFDARTAISLMEREGHRIDGLVFIAAPITNINSSDVYSWRNVARWGTDPGRWRELLFSRRGRQRALRALKLTVNRTLGRSFEKSVVSVSPVFEKHFEMLVRSHARALFLYGAEDEEYVSFRVGQKELFALLDARTRQRFDVEIWSGRVHTVLEVPRQREILERSIGWIMALDCAAERNRAASLDTPEPPAVRA
jgi:pimeloyl-ACP methyl ester carboxylesterase